MRNTEKKFNSRISAIIIDDEAASINTLRDYLQNNQRIHIIGAETDPAEGLKLVVTLKPELLFLDIQMQVMTGFELLGKLRNAGICPYVIFVTAYERFAIEAIRNSAFDYILKPIDQVQLTLGIERFLHFIENRENQDYNKLLKNTTNNDKIRFNVSGGFILIDHQDIIYIKADWNYSLVVLSDNRSELITINIGTIENQLADYPFFRINRSALINLNYLVRVKRMKRICILEKDGERHELGVSVSRLKNLERMLSN